MKARKSMKAMRAMRAMKAKTASKVARGKYAKVLVFRGRKEKTVGGVTADGLMKNKKGRVVNKRRSAHSKRLYRRGLEEWVQSLMEARKALHAKGFVAINGRTLQGKALYIKAKELLERRKAGGSASSSAAAASSASTLG
eukprot:CAMPEP_0179042896 /NCGR_PEP_ID=MMETSP0796-20121207/16892_1 /TAXON_ID=73915 /ORGANISM="Pyrodinium bahamense, Strain pbaha01" /LENGTH=139 /DNA_ID=CAMNT_0020739273 /DNA_START=123 /DNA_END=542 /DNA_ORIENTATION=-